MSRVTQQGESRAGTGARSFPGCSQCFPRPTAALLQALHLPGSGLWEPWEPGLLLTTPVVCFSLPAACYLFNSDREKEGSSVLRDHAHFLAYSPTVCPGHPEIQNHDCLKRGKWWPRFASSVSISWKMLVPSGFCGNHAFPWEPGDGYCMGPASFLRISLACATFVLEPYFLRAPCVCVALGQELRADAHHPLSLCQR